MNDIVERLFAMRDPDYAAFVAKLTPSVSPDSVVGVRVPQLRTLAKSFVKTPEYKAFVEALPHRYYEENLLHGLSLSLMSDFEGCLAATESFLPFVDNWAVCDILSPKVFARHKPQLMDKIREWVASDMTYTCRFGIRMLMCHFLDDDFAPGIMEMPASVSGRDDYYVRMMVAWFFATALAKQWDETLAFITQRPLAPWTHNKTLQKACESYRISPQQKEYLKTLKVK